VKRSRQTGVSRRLIRLTIAGRDVATDVTFTDHGNGGLACALPTGVDPESGPEAMSASSPESVPAESDLRLSLDETGQLPVDVVLAGGTLEPIWTYARPPGAAAEP
jgi:hypothetical protein